MKNPWADENSLVEILSNNGYYILFSGKWHIGEAEGMRPHDVDFDEFYGYFPAQKEIPQRIDARRYTDLVLNEKLLHAFETISPANRLTHGFKGGETKELEEIKSTDYIGRTDHKLTDFTVSKIKELAKSDKPFFIEHCFMNVHADNFDNPDYPGLSASNINIKCCYRDGCAHRANAERSGRGKHFRLHHLRQWSANGCLARCWLHPFPRS
ncbi:MAG: sulfatase-like hydrolase/transferase [Bacteroidales bacterium]